MIISEHQVAELLDANGLGALRSLRQVLPERADPIFIVNRELVLRVGVRDPDRRRFVKEANIYRRLHGLAVPTPRVYALDTSRSVLPCDALFLERLDGRDALEVWPVLDSIERQRLSFDLGRALATAHSERYARYGGLADDGTLGRVDNWRTYLLDKAGETLLDLWGHEGLPQPLLYGAEDYLRRSAIPDHPPGSLIQGDFGLHNVLLARAREGWQVSGLLDFQWAMAGDAEYEFATGLLLEPDDVNPLSQPFLRGYRSVRHLSDDWTRRVAAYRLIYHLSLCRDVCQLYAGDLAMLRYHRGMIVDILKEWL
jgi:hygromycin-B 7''-O-kinase